MTVAARFWTKVDKSDSCWVWTGAHDATNYGWFIVKAGAWKKRRSHRIAWEITYGPIPTGSLVLHRCDNHACVRPDHLFLGSQQDNMNDKMIKGRHRAPIGIINGRAKLTEADVLDIRAIYAAGVTGTYLSRRYDISRKQIRDIVKRICWKHI